MKKKIIREHFMPMPSENLYKKMDIFLENDST